MSVRKYQYIHVFISFPMCAERRTCLDGSAKLCTATCTKGPTSGGARIGAAGDAPARSALCMGSRERMVRFASLRFSPWNSRMSKVHYWRLEEVWDEEVSRF